MQWRASRWSRRSGWAVAAAVLAGVVGMALSLLAWEVASRQVRTEHVRDFDAFADQTLARLEASFTRYGDAVYSFLGLFTASEGVTRREFEEHYRTLRLAQRHPGVRAVQFAPVVRGDALAGFLDEVRADPALDPALAAAFEVRPPGPRPVYMPIVYSMPVEGNEPALGLDLMFGDERFASVADARDRGELTVSVPQRLVQGDPPLWGVLLRAPVYAKDRPLDTVAQRRAAFLGVVSAVFVTSDLVQQILPSAGHGHYDVRVTDVGPTSYRHGDPLPEPALVHSQGRGEYPEHKGEVLQRVHYLDIGGRIWQVQVAHAEPRYALTALPLAVLALGLLLTAIVSGSLAGLASLYHRAMGLARRLSMDALDSAARLRGIMNSTVDGIVTVDANGVIRSVNTATQRMFGLHTAELLGHELSRIIPALPTGQVALPEVTQLEATRDLHGQRADGTLFPIELTLSPLEMDGRPHLVGILRDLTDKRQAEEAFRKAQRQLRESDTLRRVIFDSAPFAIMACDTHGLIQAMNPAAEAMLGYRQSDVVGRVTPALFHDFDEMADRARALSQELGRTVQRDFSVFTARALQGQADEQEWTYLRKDGSRLPVRLSISAMKGDRGQVTGFLSIAYDITDRKRAEAHIRHLAHHDALTGLPNRVLLQDRAEAAMARARRDGEQVGLMFVDLDRFKTINDSLGHHVGDALLRELAGRLVALVREYDTVARMGGDEFVVLMPGLSGPAEAESIALRLLSAMSQPATLGPYELRVGASAGMALFPSAGQDLSTLMRHADAAMYAAKAQGRNRYCLFSDDMEASGADRIRLESALHHALERQELVLLFQPQFSCSTGHLRCAEALLRWYPQGMPMVSPADFIPIAEETGLIVPIGRWALREACRQAVAWNRHAARPVGVAVNLSPRQLTVEGCAEDVFAALEETGLPPHLLELEITEGAVVSDIDHACALLCRLRARGVRIAIDDFGVGYSSLSYLQTLPVDALKIDRSFVSEIGQSALDDPQRQGQLARALIGLAHGLQLRITAEGVEHPHQLTFLTLHGCDDAQGYLLGKPMPAADLLELVRDLPPEDATPSQPDALITFANSVM